MRRLAIAGLMTLAPVAAARGVTAHNEPVRVTIDGARRSDPVTRYEYGMFIEPIGNLVARTLWAEMLDDRKFYFPIIAQSKDTPHPTNADFFPGMATRKWRSVGAEDAVAMDTSDPYVGKQSASVAVAGDEPRGLGQSGIGIAKGKRYDGYLYLS